MGVRVDFPIRLPTPPMDIEIDSAPILLSAASATMPNRIIRWKRHWGDRDPIVWINVAKLDVAWVTADPHKWVGADGRGGIHPRYDRFGKWIAECQEQVLMPSVCIYEGGVTFSDGRHRFAWLRDHGVRALPISAQRGDVRKIAKLYGSRSRICRLPIPFRSNRNPKDRGA